MKRALTLLVAALALAACRDSKSPLTPSSTPGADGPSRAISDGANGGNPYFYFLQPIAPTSPAPTGVFNPRLLLVVTICESSGSVCNGAPLVEFAGADIQVSTADQHYRVNWDTERNPGTPGKTYRIFVRVRTLVGGQPGFLNLGYADVYVASTPKDVRNSVDNTTLALLDGRTVPVKVRPENGAVAYARDPSFVCNDCAEATARPGVATDLVAPSGFGATHLPADAIHPAVGPVTVTIARKNVYTEGPCLPTALEQAEACYRYDTEPFLQHGFGKDHDGNGSTVLVRVEQCFDPNRDKSYFQLHKYSARRANDGIVALEPAGPAQLIQCQGFAPSKSPSTASRGGPLLRLARGGWQHVRGPLAWLLAPTALHAGDTGLTGSTGSYSDIGWLRPVTLSAVGDTKLSTSTGSTTVTVRVLNVHRDLPEAGVPVTFVVTGGGGSVSQTTVSTDAEGIASVTWTLGTGNEANTLTASVAAGSTPVTGVVPSVSFSATHVLVIGLGQDPKGTPACASCALADEFSIRGLAASLASRPTRAVHLQRNGGLLLMAGLGG